MPACRETGSCGGDFSWEGGIGWALLTVILLTLSGCTPAPPSAGPQRGTVEPPQQHWSDSLDEAVFGSGAESLRARRASEERSGTESAKRGVGQGVATHDGEDSMEEIEKAYAHAPDTRKSRYLQLLQKGLDRRLQGRSNEEILAYIENKIQICTGALRDFYTRVLVLGILAKIEGDPRELILFFEDKVTSAPSGVRWLYRRMLADRRLSLREHDAARAEYEILLTEIPETFRTDPSVHGNIAVTYYRLGRLDDARAFARRALVLDGQFPEGLKTLGLVQLQSGRIEEGVAFLERAVALKNALPEAQVALAEYDEKVGRPDVALERYRYLLATVEAPDFRDPFYQWLYLFPGVPGSTIDELRARIRRLEGDSAVIGNENSPSDNSAIPSSENREDN